MEGDVVSISFNANTAWKAASSASWLTVTPVSGDAGDVTVKASALKNDSNDAREATVTITAGTASAKVTVTQSQLDAMNIATTDYVVEAEGGTVEIPVSANVDYSVTVPDAVDWIHVTSTKGMVDTKITLTVDGTHEYVKDETTGEILEDAIARSAKLTIAAAGITKEVTVGQKAFVPYFDFDGDYSSIQYGGRMTIPQEGGTFSINVVTNLPWR
ncbi:MAG: BACON domain-containing protein, partial [Bacteroidales bacterium]|nr:BACON domain-containing protein [Bacteroidales bacterium]